MFDQQGFFSPLSKIGISYKVKKGLSFAIEMTGQYNEGGIH